MDAYKSTLIQYYYFYRCYQDNQQFFSHNFYFSSNLVFAGNVKTFAQVESTHTW